jgi:hypothetical protein
MGEQNEKLRLEGIVHGFQSFSLLEGGEFPALLECDDGAEWVISYGEQSPFHAFAERRVRVTGQRYKPTGAYVIGTSRKPGQRPGHLRVSTMRLLESTPDAQLIEVGEERDLSGRFTRETSDGGRSILSFATEEGTRYLVANEPAGVRRSSGVIRVTGFPVELSPLFQKPSDRYLWIICPCSAGDIMEWRGRTPSIK